MSKNKKTHRKINKKTHRKINKKTSRRNKTNRRIKLRFNKIGGNRTCLDVLRAKYGQDVFWTGGITIEQIYDDALNIRCPDVIQLIRQVRERISKISIPSSVYSPPNKAEMTRLICVELKKVTDMLGEERSINIFRPTLPLCGKFAMVLGEYNSPHYKFLLEYLDCLINIMEFSLLERRLVEDEQASRAEAPRAEAVGRQEEVRHIDPPVEWYFEGLEPRAGPAAGPAAEPRAEPIAGPIAGPSAEPIVGPIAGPIAGQDV